MRTRSTSITQPQPPSRPTSSAMGMTPETRYQYNIKVLRRRDPSIVSILDQFSHVCVYHHNGERWEKNGYEGSMFLYERSSYPPYGFYILNRMGMDDHIQRLYPWDNITAQNSITMLRSFPSFSKNRTDRVHETLLPDERPDKFAEVYRWDKDKEQVSESEMGEGVTIGLWFYNTEGREAMSTVLLRLQQYIKQNIPYPEEFRYGPHKPPPTNLQSPATTPAGRAPSVASSSGSASSSNQHTRSQSYSPEMLKVKPRQLQGSDTPRASATNSSSELDKLFAKLMPTPTSSSVSPKSASSSKTVRPEQSAKLTIESLFASAQPQTQAPASATNGNGTGLALLNTIFASASNSSSLLNPPLSSSSTSTTFPNSTPSNTTSSSSNPSSRAPSRASASSRPISQSHSKSNSHSQSRTSLRHHPSQPRLVPPSSSTSNSVHEPETIQILSPIPTTSPNAPSSVLMLTQEVMNGLLGGGGAQEQNGTRSSSTAPKSKPTPPVSVPAQKRVEPQEAVKSINVPALLAGLFAGAPPGHSTDNTSSSTSVLPGDLTPRPPVPAELDENVDVNGHGAKRDAGTSGASSYFGQRSDMDYHEGQAAKGDEEADYNDDDDDDEIIELDFSDTRALSDMKVFDSEKEKKKEERERERSLSRNAMANGINGYTSSRPGSVVSISTSSPAPGRVYTPSQTQTHTQIQVNGVAAAVNGATDPNGASVPGKKKTRRGKGKKEREKERMQAHSETEGSEHEDPEPEHGNSESGYSVSELLALGLPYEYALAKGKGASVSANVSVNGASINVNGFTLDPRNVQPASPSPTLSPSPSPSPLPLGASERLSTPARYPGSGPGSGSGSPVTAKPHPDYYTSTSTTITTVNGVHSDSNAGFAAVKKESLLDALFASAAQGQGAAGRSLIRGKEDLAREVVRLVQTDKAFVDSLWSSWQKRSLGLA